MSWKQTSSAWPNDLTESNTPYDGHPLLNLTRQTAAMSKKTLGDGAAGRQGIVTQKLNDSGNVA